MKKESSKRGQLRARHHTARPREPRLCIFCVSNKNPLTAPEHIHSEALGNKRLILPPGDVCDPCNHGALSGLDKFHLSNQPARSGACSERKEATRPHGLEPNDHRPRRQQHPSRQRQRNFLVETGREQLTFNPVM